MSKLGIILTYLSALVACVFIIASIVTASSDTALAGYLAALACFFMLLGVWVNVCS